MPTTFTEQAQLDVFGGQTHAAILALQWPGVSRFILRVMTADKKHDHTPEEEREIREASLDETIEDSFPASDPPSTNPNPDDHDAARRAAGTPGKRSPRSR